MESLDEQDAPFSAPANSTWTLGIADRRLLMRALLIGGVMLFLLAGSIGQLFATHSTGNSSTWSPDEATQIAWNIRAFAALSFIAGLTERIAFEIALLRRQMSQVKR